MWVQALQAVSESTGCYGTGEGSATRGSTRIDIQHMGVKTDEGDKVLLVAVDKASKLLFAFPLLMKEALGIARRLLEVMLTFRRPMYVPSDPGSEFTAKVLQHLCKWLMVTIV